MIERLRAICLLTITAVTGIYAVEGNDKVIPLASRPCHRLPHEVAVLICFSDLEPALSTHSVLIAVGALFSKLAEPLYIYIDHLFTDSVTMAS